MNKTKTRKKRHIQALTWLLLTLLLVAGCRESSTTVSIVEPRARLTPGVASTGAVYMNALDEEGEDRVRAAYGATTYDRLVEFKNEYDPTNLFRLNQNINPTVG